ncbi:MAG: glucose-1-phosphate adenylyltransferase subunit GlgD [Clostridiales bacterium]|jgi:glucose-1-phosphate adenylyltransferase|nr:glucose-1-phosphate adenylyltransferase subunit GlgD [Clostridiales bacterium]
MKAIGIILAGGNNERLGALTDLRATSAVPVGSCYRALDFPLSNMSNSGIGKVAVITQYNSRSLHDHLSSSKWWDLGRKQGGLFVFSPYLTSKNSFWFRGTADSIYQNITYLKRSNESYVVITSGNAIYKMDYNDLITYHIQKDADVTIMYSQAADGDDVRQYGVMEFDEFERLTDLEEKPLDPQSDLISMGVYVIQRTLLIKLLEAIQAEERYDLVKDIFIRYRKKLRIYGYRFNGYWKSLNNVKSYYDCNMDFLKKDIRDLFTKNAPFIETKPKDEPPGKYNIGAQAKDALVGSGSIINGYINHSVLFRKVFTGENSCIRNSIIMESSYIGNNCVVENAILDKEVVLSDGKQIIGTPENPVIVAKSTVL